MVFKQLLQAEAIDVCQIDSVRLAGVTEVLSVLLMAAKFGIPVCPHAGGVGLCEHVIHLRSVSTLIIFHECGFTYSVQSHRLYHCIRYNGT
jgi:L-fuconate dehydratase